MKSVRKQGGIFSAKLTRHPWKGLILEQGKSEEEGVANLKCCGLATTLHSSSSLCHPGQG